jgi:dienelactone hydrolase
MDVAIPAAGHELPGILEIPTPARGLVVFAHGSGSSRLSPRNAEVAAALNTEGLATLLFDLLTIEEAADRSNVFDIGLLARRLQEACRWAATEPAVAGLLVGLFGASTGAAAALVAAARTPGEVAAVVSRGGRPDLAGEALDAVEAPTLLIVGSRDEVVLDLNHQAAARMHCEHRVAVVPGATHLFEEPGALEEVAGLATAWFGHRMP